MSNLSQKQQLQNTVDKLLRIEKAKRVSEVCGVIAALVVGIGCGIAGLPILSISLMAFAAGWTVGLVADGIKYPVSKPSDKLDKLNLKRVENTLAV